MPGSLTKADVSNFYSKLLVFLADVKQQHVSQRKHVTSVGSDADGSCVPFIVLALWEENNHAFVLLILYVITANTIITQSELIIL